MQTEFQKLSLDRVRYSIVWEGHRTLFQGLQINSSDHVLMISSAGCNVLNALLKSPRELVAIDLNPIQNALLDFKRFIISNCTYQEYAGILGLNGKLAVQQALNSISPKLSADSRSYWARFFNKHPEGIMTSGQLEAYLTGFLTTLPRSLQNVFGEVIQCKNLECQSLFFEKSINTEEFKNYFIRYFNRENLSKARDPKLFKYIEEDGGTTFYKRLVRQSKLSLWGENFHFRFFFFGPENLPQSIIPPSYQENNFETLKREIHKLQIVQGEAVEYLLSLEGESITKASLSNIFEYTTHEEFELSIGKLMNNKNRKLRIIYWNLLQNQIYRNIKTQLISDDQFSALESCFYFRNACVCDNQII